MIDDVSLDRSEPGFGCNEDAECHLDFGNAPAMRLLDRTHEQRPGVLQIGNQHHAEYAEPKLHPAIWVALCLPRHGMSPEPAMNERAYATEPLGQRCSDPLRSLLQSAQPTGCEQFRDFCS